MVTKAKKTAEDSAEESTAVAKASQGGAIVPHDYGEHAGQGFENQTSADIKIPFITILQSNSPQLLPVKDGGIDGAKAGMIFNTGTEDLIDGDKGLVFVPGTTQHLFVEWVPRDKGGGFVGIHTIDSDIVKAAKEHARKNKFKFGKYQTPGKDGAMNDLVETFYVYGVLEESESIAVLSFSSSKINAYKTWSAKVNSLMVPTPNGKRKVPLFAHRVRLTTVMDSNEHGKFYVASLSPAEEAVKDDKGNIITTALVASLLAPSDPRFQAAFQVGEMVNQGLVKADYQSQNAAGSETVDPSTGEVGKSHF